MNKSLFILNNLILVTILHSNELSDDQLIDHQLQMYVQVKDPQEQQRILHHLADSHRLAEVASHVNDVNLWIARAAVLTCEMANYKPAQKLILMSLKDKIGVSSAGGSEYYALENDYIRNAWRVYVKLTGRLALNQNAIPSRQVVLTLD